MSVAEPAGQERILITGATSAIGGELALYYAKPGTELMLHGRNAAILEPLAERCRQAGAQVLTHQLDLRDLDALHGWIIVAGVGLRLVQSHHRSSGQLD